MSDTESSTELPVQYPGVADGSALVPPHRSWRYGIAPHYIGLFLWVGFVERLGRATIPIGGLGFSLLGVVIAGVLCYELLFRRTASWGRSADRTTSELAERVFGAAGARFVGALVGLAHVVWFAVATSLAADYILDALVTLGFLPSAVLAPTQFGDVNLPSKLYLVTTLFWCFATALTATWLVRVIAALMNVYPLFPGLALGAAMLILMGHLMRFSPTGIDPLDGRAVPVGQGSLLAIVRSIQYVFGFFAFAGLLSADWGKGSETSSDVVKGGWVGVAFAPPIVAAIGLLLVAAYQGKVAPSYSAESSPEPGVIRRSFSVVSIEAPAAPPPLVVRDAINKGIGGRTAGVMLLILGLGSLAPAVYASFSFAHRFKESVGGISRVAWMLIGTSLAWPLIVSGWTRDLESVFGLMGAVFAPIVGAYAAAASRDRGAWLGPRPGTAFGVFAACVAGTMVGLIPYLPLGAASRIQPAALWAFGVGYVLTRLLDRGPKPINPEAVTP